MKKIKDYYKELEIRLKVDLGFDKRKTKFFVDIFNAIIIQKDVRLSEISKSINSKAKLKSTETRVQNFFKKEIKDFLPIGAILKDLASSILNKKNQKFKLAIDRTNWKFGKQNNNILMISIVTDNNIGIPLLWEMLDKKGNSHTSERTDLMEELFKIIEPEEIDCFLGDREFIGEKWLNFLDKKGVNFIIRSRENLTVKGEKRDIQINKFFRKTANKGVKYSKEPQNICGGKFYIYTKNEKDKIYLISNIKSKKVVNSYKKRWQIESLFRALKKRGFNLEKTHLKNLDRIKNLIFVVSIAFIFCFIAGQNRAKKEKIKILVNKQPEYSIFTYGFQLLNQLLTNIYSPIRPHLSIYYDDMWGS